MDGEMPSCSSSHNNNTVENVPSVRDNYCMAEDQRESTDNSHYYGERETEIPDINTSNIASSPLVDYDDDSDISQNTVIRNSSHRLPQEPYIPNSETGDGNALSNVANPGCSRLPSFQHAFGSHRYPDVGQAYTQLHENNYQSTEHAADVQSASSSDYHNHCGHSTPAPGQSNQPLYPFQGDEPKCLGNEIFYFLKTCISELDRAMTNGPASSQLASCVLTLEDMHQVVQGDEERFKADLLNNGHKNHRDTFCGRYDERHQRNFNGM